MFELITAIALPFVILFLCGLVLAGVSPSQSTTWARAPGAASQLVVRQRVMTIF